MKYISLTAIILFLGIGCSSNKNVTSSEEEVSPRNSQRPEKPSLEDIFKMDTNLDGKLDKTEVKGRLLDNFSNIDTDGDGFITKTELENAPKPERGQRGQRPPKRN